MKPIELNGKKYVLKEAYDKLKKLKTKVVEKKVIQIKKVEVIKWKKTDKPIVDEIKIHADPANVMGIGSLKLISGKFVHTKMSIGYIKNAIKILEAVGSESISFVVAEDMPLMMGTLKGTTLSGVLIAPRVAND